MENNVDNRLLKAKQAKQKADANLKRIIKQVKDSERKKDRNRKILLGYCILEAMKYDENLKRYIPKLLNKHLTRDCDRKVFDLELLKDQNSENDQQNEEGVTQNEQHVG